jgi:hypothetical protein
MCVADTMRRNLKSPSLDIGLEEIAQLAIVDNRHALPGLGFLFCKLNVYETPAKGHASVHALDLIKLYTHHFARH